MQKFVTRTVSAIGRIGGAGCLKLLEHTTAVGFISLTATGK